MRFKEFFNSYIESITGFDDDENRAYIQRLSQTLHLLNDLGYVDLAKENTIPFTNSTNIDLTRLIHESKLNFEYLSYSPDKQTETWLVDYFFDAIRINKKSFFLTPYSKEELSKMYLFKVKTLDAGFAIKETGDYHGEPTRDIVAVHNNSKVKGIGKDLVLDAVKEDGTTLDHFDGFLSSLYGPLGFEAYALDEWNDEYTPTDWDYSPLDIRNKTYHSDKLSEYDPEKQEKKREQYASGKPDVIYRKIKR